MYHITFDSFLLQMSTIIISKSNKRIIHLRMVTLSCLVIALYDLRYFIVIDVKHFFFFFHEVKKKKKKGNKKFTNMKYSMEQRIRIFLFNGQHLFLICSIPTPIICYYIHNKRTDQIF